MGALRNTGSHEGQRWSSQGCYRQDGDQRTTEEIAAPSNSAAVFTESERSRRTYIIPTESDNTGGPAVLAEDSEKTMQDALSGL